MLRLIHLAKLAKCDAAQTGKCRRVTDVRLLKSCCWTPMHTRAKRKQIMKIGTTSKTTMEWILLTKTFYSLMVENNFTNTYLKKRWTGICQQGVISWGAEAAQNIVLSVVGCRWIGITGRSFWPPYFFMPPTLYLTYSDYKSLGPLHPTHQHLGHLSQIQALYFCFFGGWGGWGAFP